jgi:hypothetical protein
MFRKPRKMASYRMDEITLERLKSMSEELQVSQADFLESLINAAFDAACKSWDLTGFKRFCDGCKEAAEAV